MKNVLLLAAFGLFGIAVQAQTPLTTAVDFTVTTVEGSSFNLFNTLAANKYVCIDFFYYGCVPCQQTAPKVNEAYEHFGCNSSNIVFIGIDNGDNEATTIAFGTNFGADYPAASGTGGGGDAVNNAYGISAYPTVILIAPDHTIVEQDIWPIANGAYLYNLIESHGGIPAACASGIGTEQSDQSTITGIFPNPVAENTTISINLKDNGDAVIGLYNLTGQQLLELNAGNLAAGIHRIDLPLKGIAEGLYIVKLMQHRRVTDQSKLFIAR